MPADWLPTGCRSALTHPRLQPLVGAVQRVPDSQDGPTPSEDLIVDLDGGSQPQQTPTAADLLEPGSPPAFPPSRVQTARMKYCRGGSTQAGSLTAPSGGRTTNRLPGLSGCPAPAGLGRGQPRASRPACRTTAARAAPCQTCLHPPSSDPAQGQHRAKAHRWRDLLRRQPAMQVRARLTGMRISLPEGSDRPAVT